MIVFTPEDGTSKNSVIKKYASKKRDISEILLP
jgi:hypothetical protein